MGQEQDSLNGGYLTSQVLKGTLYDVRVWNSAISDEQIALNYQQSPGTSETGLISNWRMSGLSGGNTVVDSVGGVNLTVANVALGGGFTASTPTAGLVVTENASVGTRVGQLIATDMDLSRNVVSDVLFREGPNPVPTWIILQGSRSATGRCDLAMSATTVPKPRHRHWRSHSRFERNDGRRDFQTLSTVAGRQYQVVFAMSGHWGGGDAVKDLRVSADGASQDFSMTQPTGWSTSNMLFSNRSFTFTATDASTYSISLRLIRRAVLLALSSVTFA